MRHAKWYGWERDENGKTNQVYSRAQQEADKKEYEALKKLEVELESYYSTLTEAELIAIQEDLAKKIDLTNRLSVSQIRTIGGVDLIYTTDKNGNEVALCSIVVMDFRTLEIIDVANGAAFKPIAYHPGFLSFREIPAMLAAYKFLWCKPDVMMFDGNGYLHYRHMGLATHAALMLGVPTFGVAKSYLKIEDVDYIMPPNEVGSYTDIVIKGEVYGRALRTRKDVKPVFVSCGNWLDLDTTTVITLSLITPESRLPTPTRQADINSRASKKMLVNLL